MSDHWLLDSNVLIALLAGDRKVAALTEDRFIHISFVSRIEVLSWPKLQPEQVKGMLAFLARLKAHAMSDAIEEQAIRLRRTYNLKLGDSIIAATAIVGEMPLMTGDKHFARLKTEIDLRLL